MRHEAQRAARACAAHACVLTAPSVKSASSCGLIPPPELVDDAAAGLVAADRGFWPVATVDDGPTAPEEDDDEAAGAELLAGSQRANLLGS